MEQTKFNFKEDKNLDNINEDLKNTLHEYLVINEVVSDNLYDTIKEVLDSDSTISKDNEEHLKNLLNKIDEFNKEIKTTNINLEKKRTGLLSEDDKFRIFSFYETKLFSQTQLGRFFGVAQSTISRVVSQIRDTLHN
jgi:DNA-directed RNA polymerase specialized sigma subunit